jgi:hypothetical protein
MKTKGFKKQISRDMIEAWVGSDNMGADDFLELLVDIANGKYPVELFREDVLDYAKQEGEAV